MVVELSEVYSDRFGGYQDAHVGDVWWVHRDFDLDPLEALAERAACYDTRRDFPPALEVEICACMIAHERLLAWNS